MKVGRLRSVLDSCFRLTAPRSAGDSTDGHLLRRFAAGRDPAAFDGLLERHGPLVLGVCRRVLRDPHEAEDAFQATFLVLLRKAGSLDGRTSLAGWLYTVAYRIALKVRAGAARRRALEARPAGPAPAGPDEDAAARELQPVLDEEIGRLPEKYRQPIVLCYLQGKTTEEAARLLGWPVGTVSGRLARARERLRARLGRRGLGLAGTAPAAEAVPDALARATARAAADPPAAGAPLAVLVDRAVRQLALARARSVAVLLLAAAALLGAAAVAVPRLRHERAAVPPEPGARVPEALPAVVVRASYPGATARVLADTVAWSLEQKLDGVEGMAHMVSRCDSDGNCTLTVTFAAGTDLDRALGLVRQRVALARPALPAPVKAAGITVRKKPGDVLLFVVLAPDGKHDTVSLSKVATAFVKGELARVPGVGEVVLFERREDGARVTLDPDKLASCAVTAADVVRALREQNVQVAAGQIGQPPVPTGQDFQYTLSTLGRLRGKEDVERVVVRADREGRTLQVRDVASVDSGPTAETSEARYNGKPVLALSVAPAPGADAAEVGAAVRARLARLRERLPEGARLETIGGTTGPGYLRLDVALPDDASRERTLAALERCQRLLAGMAGVRGVLAITGPPVATGSNRGCLVVSLATVPGGAAGRARVAAAIRARLTEQMPEALVRLGDPARPGQFSPEGYAVALAVCGPDERRLRELAWAFADRLNRSGKLTDVSPGPEARGHPALEIDVSRERAAALGVPINEVFKTLQTYLGSFYINDFNDFGRTWQVIVSGPGAARLRPEDVKRLKVRNSRGELVSLGALLEVRERDGAAVVQRFNNRPMVTVTANLGPGLSPAAARALCEGIAAEVLPAGYRLVWLRELPRAE
jgi:RNA polymerase sigma factor (sigma-70 family)